MAEGLGLARGVVVLAVFEDGADGVRSSGRYQRASGRQVNHTPMKVKSTSRAFKARGRAAGAEPAKWPGSAGSPARLCRGESRGPAWTRSGGREHQPAAQPADRRQALAEEDDGGGGREQDLGRDQDRRFAGRRVTERGGKDREGERARQDADEQDRGRRGGECVRG